MAYDEKLKRLAIILLSFFLLYFFYKTINSSILLKNRERLNIVFYGQNSLFYSLGEDVNYFFTLPADIEVLVPGGYGNYRLGALGKLVALEKKPEIFKITFSSLTSSMIDLYFYPSSPKIYYEGNDISSKIIFPSLNDIFFNQSNANLIDRLFISFFFLNKKHNQYTVISNFAINKIGTRALFNRENFFKKNQGMFYNKTYRNIKNNVQIIYTKSYKTAKLISQIIEGEGIRVVDMSQSYTTAFKSQNLENLEHCLVIENKKKPSLITADLQRFFSCRFKQGENEISDIILFLGKIEKEWGID